MKSIVSRLFSALVGSLLLAGCASYSGSSLPPGARQAEVKQLMGEPAAIHPAGPGQQFTESWEYPRGPLGRHTYMARFDASGKLVRLDQVLTQASVARIALGSAKRDDVRALLGRPGMILADRKGGETWDYAAYAPDGMMRKIRIGVTFDSNGVATAAGESPDPEEWSPNGPE